MIAGSVKRYDSFTGQVKIGPQKAPIAKAAIALMLLLFAVVLLLSACTGPEAAPEFQGIEGWINSGPLSLEDLRGRVVLVDFWTYSCVNCIRTFPYLKEWHRKYSAYGLVIVGIHTPEFGFEKLRENVESAVESHGLEYPIAQDNDYRTWNAYANNAWPAKYLIDRQGELRYHHLGEGSYTETEEVIRELLSESGSGSGFPLQAVKVNSLPEPEEDPEAFGPAPGRRLTRELYAGYYRNESLPYSSAPTLFGGLPAYILQEEYYRQQDAAVFYEDLGGHLNNFIYLQGLWQNGRESLTHARVTEDYEDYIAIKFYANSVNAVMRGVSGSPEPVRITLDGLPLGRESAGADVTFAPDGSSYVLVGRPKMYRLVEKAMFSGHEMQVSPKSADFSLFAFTFGAYPQGP